MELTFAHSAWFILVCLGVAAVYTVFLYRKDKLLGTSSSGLKWVLRGLRFVAVFGLALFLLEPLLKIKTVTVEKPLLVVAQDNSSSVVAIRDSAFYQTAYKQDFEALDEALSDKFDIRYLSFGEEVRQTEGVELNFQDKFSDIAQVLDEIRLRYYGRNIGGVVLASDGIYNKGSNPSYNPLLQESPIFCLALGDSAVQRDLILKEVRHNRLAYLGNKFPLEVFVQAQELIGQQAVLKVKSRGKVLFEEELSFDADNASRNVSIQLEAEKVGLQRFEVELEQLSGEVTYINNRQDFFVDVLDGRQRILLLYRGPHPDIGALRSALANQENFQLEVQSYESFDQGFDPYNLVILHDIPASFEETQRLKNRLDTEEVPVLWMFTGRSNWQHINRLDLGVQHKQSNAQANTVTAVAVPGFSLFSIPELFKEDVHRYPPLHVPFGQFDYPASASVLLKQRVGVHDTEDPLVLFKSDLGAKQAFILGEGIWRWRLQAFVLDNAHAAFDQLILKIVQYLNVKDDKRNFRIQADHDFSETEPVVFQAEVYNKSYELDNSGEVQLLIENVDGEKYEFSFSRTDGAYRLDAGSFPVGEYKYTAKTVRDGSEDVINGVFSVSAVQLEFVQTQADNQLLRNVAALSGGAVYAKEQVSALTENLKGTEAMVAARYWSYDFKDLIEHKWVFFVLLGLLSLEWLLRKLNGAY